MEEKEAKTKWCPIRWRSIITDGSTMFNGDLCKCAASNCMMWRSTDNEVKSEYPYDQKPKIQPAGYCGIGGKP